MFKALYKFNNEKPGFLSFQKDDKFTILDMSNKDWFQAQNGRGDIGYVPHNYLTVVNEASPEEVLNFIDWSIKAIELQASGEGHGHYTAKQQTDLQRLIAHRDALRTEFEKVHDQKKMCSDAPRPARTAPDPPAGSQPGSPSKTNVTKVETVPERKLDEVSVNGDGSPINHINALQTFSDDSVIKETQHQSSLATSGDTFDNLENPEKIGYELDAPADIHGCLEIPEKIGAELIEEVRRSTGLSFEKCKIAVETILGYVGFKVPALETVMEQILKSLHLGRDISDEDVSSHDAQRLTVIFSELTACKDDAQQRSWALHEDEAIIKEYLEELLSILENAKPSICSKVVARDNYDILHSLVQYYQMETRSVLCRLLLRVFGALCGLHKDVLTNLLYSVLPTELAEEIRLYTDDVLRKRYAATVMTMIFSMGDPVSTAVSDQLDEDYFLQVLNLIENPPSEQFEDGAVDMLLAFIISFNLHLNDPINNTVLQALAKHGTPKVFTERIMILLNRGDDPTKMFGYNAHTPNAVLKLFHDMYTDITTSDLLYTNDAKVLVDVIISRLSSLSPDDKTRCSFLRLCQLFVQNSLYSEHRHRADELKRLLQAIMNEEAETPDGKRIAADILANTEIFSAC